MVLAMKLSLLLSVFLMLAAASDSSNQLPDSSSAQSFAHAVTAAAENSTEALKGRATEIPIKDEALEADTELLADTSNKISAGQLSNDSAPIAKNIILMVGDGMGLTQISAAMQASSKPLHLERANVIGLIKTGTAKEQITDSAASATAFATGLKTLNGAVGVDEAGEAQETILESLGKAGYATGLIATSTITHATPASFYAHQKSRQHYYEIAADMVNAPLNLFVGGGKSHFYERNDAKRGERDDRNILTELENIGFSFVNSVAELESTSGKVAYFLADEQPKSVEDGRGDVMPKSIRPSINSLLKQSDAGFFLMVEGSQIDWGGHANRISYVLSELYDFDQAVGHALDFAAADGNTLVIITADHETGGLSLQAADTNNKNAYNRASEKFATTGHTSTMVPVFAFGPGAELFSGVYENTAIYNKMYKALACLEPNLLQPDLC